MLSGGVVEGTPFGQYRLIELLGRGGMGEVWRAYDTVTDRIVALKLLPPYLAADTVFKQRFRREAHAAAQLNVPHVVPIHTYGEIDGRLFVDMRLINGRDLHAVLADGPLAPARAVQIIDQVAKAVHAAHKAGLVHRDIKPSNILLDEDDFAYLIDFGIARAVGETGLTDTGGMIGTLRYMAPERFSTGHEVDARSDIYALACVLYECLTGTIPFPGNNPEQQLAGHLSAAPPRPSRTHPGVPVELDSVIAVGMAKNPDARYATTVELARAAREAITTPLPRPGPTMPAAPPTRPASPQPPPRQPTTSRPRPLVAPYAPTQIGPQPRPPLRSYQGSVPPPPAQPPVAPPHMQSQPPRGASSAPTTRRSKRWIVPAALLVAAAVVVGSVAIWRGTRPQSNATSASPTPTTAPISSTTTAAISSSATAAIPPVDFRNWQAFGGIDANVSGNGQAVVLDTHDTTRNWKTAWSGLIAPGPSQCSSRIAGRARDISHTNGAAGGFGIGLTTLKKDSSGTEIAYGSAVQFDFGLNGYFAVSYPGAEGYALVAAPLDHEWHEFEISFDKQGGITAQVDGKTVTNTKGGVVCGMPTIRVWAGSAEFREFSLAP